MKGLIVAWGVGEAIVIYRSIKAKQPPLPSQLLLTSGAYVVLGILAEGAPELATALAVGVDIGALFVAWPTGSTNATPSQATAAASAAGTAGVDAAAALAAG